MSGKLTPRPVCIDCGYVAGTVDGHAEVWSITKDGHWLCDDCWNDSWDNDTKFDSFLEKEGILEHCTEVAKNRIAEMTLEECESRPACDCTHCKYDQ